MYKNLYAQMFPFHSQMDSPAFSDPRSANPTLPGVQPNTTNLTPQALPGVPDNGQPAAAPQPPVDNNPILNVDERYGTLTNPEAIREGVPQDFFSSSGGRDTSADYAPGGQNYGKGPTVPNVDYSMADPKATIDYKPDLKVEEKKKHAGYGPELDPNASPLDQARAAQAFWQNQANHPTNQDHGWKGTVKEIISNFLYGMSQTRPGMNMTHALLLGGAGAGAGLVNRSWNEERQANMELGPANERVQQELQNSQRESTIANQHNEMLNRNIKTKLDIDEATDKRINDRQRTYIERWKELPKFEPGASLEDANFAKEAAAAGVTLPSKIPSGRYTAVQGQNGVVLKLNTQTGETQQVGDFAKPKNLSDTDLKDLDTVFGLPEESEYKRRATASVDKGGKSYTLKQNVTLPGRYKNADGSFKSDTYWKDYSNGNTELKPSDLFEEGSDYEKRLASAEQAESEKDKGTREQVAQLRTYLKTRTEPNSPTAVTTVPKVAAGLKAAMSEKDPKKRQAKIDAFYEALKNARIQ
jgi:hypothetical protein